MTLSAPEVERWKREVAVFLDVTVAPGTPWGGIIHRGRTLRLIDCEGRQAVDFLCYNAADPEERYNAPNTIKIAGTLHLTRGHSLYSDLARPLLRITADSYGRHDTIGGCCSAPSNRVLYGVENCPGCRENLLAALACFGLGRRDLVPNLNFFMPVALEPDGGMAIARGDSPPGSYVDLRAETDVLAVLSNCPQINNPCNDYHPTPVRVIVWDS
jgi:urea carboxylase-associated protein 1